MDAYIYKCIYIYMCMYILIYVYIIIYFVTSKCVTSNIQVYVLYINTYGCIFIQDIKCLVSFSYLYLKNTRSTTLIIKRCHYLQNAQNMKKKTYTSGEAKIREKK